MDDIWQALVRSHRSKAVALQGNVVKAIGELDECIRVVEGVRSEGLDKTTSRDSLLSRYFKLYRDMVDLCIAANDVEHLRKAMETIERSKCRTLLDIMHRVDAYQREHARRSPGTIKSATN